MGHHQLFLFIHLQQRLATQPVEQLIGIRRFQQWFQTILWLVAANTGKTASRCKSWLPSTSRTLSPEI
jgi:hypothetical protein